jgi:ferredoxin
MNEQRVLSGLTITIEQDLCIGSGNCVQLAPEVFELDGAGTVTFRDGASDIDRERLLESCRVCPVAALIATDADGQQLAP